MAADGWRPWSALTPTARVVLFTGFLGALALAAIVAELRWRSPASPLAIGWPVIAIGFAASLVWSVDLEFRNDALMLTLSEIPLIIGLIALPPVQLPLARLIGAALVLIIQRRPAVKLGFNLATYTFEAAAAAAVYHAILGHSAALGPVGWLAAAGPPRLSMSSAP